MHFTDDTLVQLTQAICDSVLGLEVWPTDPATALPHEHLTASVHITGSWNGTVSFDFPWDLARTVAARMFELDDSSPPSPDEVCDALGEIANIAGGNIKGMVDQECNLSLPTVTEGDHRMAVPGAETVSETTLVCEGLPFRVVLYAAAGQAA